MKKLIYLMMLYSCLTSCVTTSSQPLASNDNVELGLAYLQQNNVAVAKEKLLLALQESPDDAVALDAMAYFQEVTGSEKEAESYYLHAIKASPNNGAVFNNYGIYLCRHHKPQEAEEMFLKATAIPDYLNTAEAYENAGLCALTLPDKTKARYYFEKASNEGYRN